MNIRYIFGGIGSFIFSVAAIGNVFPVIFYLQERTYLTIFFFLSIGIILMGIGILDLFLQYRNKIALTAFIFSLATSSLLIISYGFFQIPIILVISYEALYIHLYLWGISFLVFAIFIFLFGIALILQRNSFRFHDLTLGAGILFLIYSGLLFIFSYIALSSSLESNMLNIFSRNYSNWILIGYSEGKYLGDLFLYLFIFGRSIYLNGMIQLSTFFIKLFSLLPLGLITILNGVIFLMDVEIKY